MPAPRGQRPATKIRVIARRVRDHAAMATVIDRKWVYERAAEIEDLAVDMNAASGVPDPTKRKRRRAAKKSAAKSARKRR